jgi:hypothetical protein
MNFNELVKLNDLILIRDVHDGSFVPYGKIINGYDFSGLLDYMEKETEVPEQGNIYEASVLELEYFPVKEKLENGFFGEMPIEIGYCNGQNSTLNGLEYHIGSEINVAVTDLVLMLGKLQDVVNYKYKTEDVEVFFVRKGTVLQLYETTLHFSPCKTNLEGFKCIVILPRGTNEPLKNDKDENGDKLLFARNKWLLAHPDRKALIEKGAWPGISGENLELKIS